MSDVRETVGARHPLVRTDRKTSRRALLLGRRHNTYVIGLNVAESEALLERLGTCNRALVHHVNSVPLPP